MRIIKAMAMLALATSMLGAHAQTTTNGTPYGDHVLQGNFQAGTPTVFLLDNSNRDRCGTGGATGAQRVNQPILGFTLPNIPAGETINAATFSFKMAATAINGAPLEFDMVVCLMDATDISGISAADFVETNAPINSALGNGIVIAQFDDGDVGNGATIDVSLTGAALTQLADLYDVSGIPSQSNVWFRMSTSTHLDMTTNINYNARFNFDDAGGAVIRSLELNWGVPPSEIYYVAATPTNWAVGSAWSDSLPAHSNANYFVTNSVALQTPTNTATFPGDELNLVGSQTVELMVSGADVITFSPLELGGDTLRAGVVDAGEAKVDGTINVTFNSTLSGATNNMRDLRVLSQITGSTTLTLTAPAKTIYIDNAANTFSGTWNLTGNYAEFTSPGALGTGSIQVGNFGKLRILGDWDGLATGETLTVADSSNAVVEVGTYAWTVSALTFGTNTVAAGAVYTTVELNAFSSNTVFAGSGTIQVGTPPLPEPGELIVGMDAFSSVSTPAVTVVKAGVTAFATASAVGGTQNWTTTDSADDLGRGSSVDTTWGTFDGDGSPANAVTNEHGANFTLTNGKTDGEISITISNTTAEAIELGQVHVDALAFRPNAARTYAVNVLAGSDITVGNVFTSEDDAITSIGGDLVALATRDAHDDIDIDLTGLADHTLEVGEGATIQLEFTSGTGAGGGHHLFVDNVAITAAGEGDPVDLSNAITDYSFDPSGTSSLSFTGGVSSAYVIKSADDLLTGGFTTITPTAATVGTLDGDVITTDGTGAATAEFTETEPVQFYLVESAP